MLESSKFLVLSSQFSVQSSLLIDVDITHLDAHLKSYPFGLLACFALGACLNVKRAVSFSRSITSTE